MGIKRPRQEAIREIEVTVPGENGERVHRGADLDDVLRQVIWDLAERSEWSLAETARRLAIAQPTLQDFFDPSKDRGLSVASMSKACAALKMSPVDLFRQHQRYRPETRDEATFVEDLVFDRFRALLSPATARRLVRLVEILNDREALGSQLETWERTLRVPEPTKKKERKAAPRKAI